MTDDIEKNTAEALKNAGRRNRKLVLLMDLLQLPLSIVFTRFLNLFSAGIPDLSSGGRSTPGWMAVRVIVLLTAIVFTGIGAAMNRYTYSPIPEMELSRRSQTVFIKKWALQRTVWMW